MSTCTGLAALDHANTKYSKGYAATSCRMVTCGRHEVVSKNGVGDLQNGEKYGNMDYVVASAWRHFHALLFSLLSYTIMSQWSKNLRDRLAKLPPAIRLLFVRCFIKFVIPKLHIVRHLRNCQEKFSLLHTISTAQADMERIERIWSSSGLMGASTREMGLGSCQDTLDDFWHFWNWNKVVGMGTKLRKRFLKATKELSAQKAWLENFAQAQREEFEAWKKAVDDFESFVDDQSAEPPTNPYRLPQSGVTLREIELELMREEQERERMSTAAPAVHFFKLNLSGAALLMMARTDASSLPTSWPTETLPSKTSPTPLPAAHGSAVKSRGYVFYTINIPPGAVQQAVTAVDVEAIEAEWTALFLPSALSPSERLPPLSVAGLTAAEASVCIALTGTSASRAVEKDEEEAKRRKQRAMKGKRQQAAQLNADGEVRSVPGMGEKSRLISWIWLEGGSMGGIIGEEMHACLKVEWCKAYARVKRW
ncbi:C2H2-type domain-containing protein [Mycena sanguinolenta]|uniref:C2H2-type domain-containing protein n=1 Tax=Mycena sanguinolenta TaxID=230812 RepID=A0A8H7DIN5_9AGAR|nr:C2H2-type domain-containing protein [Mycena sanguinolenta]